MSNAVIPETLEESALNRAVMEAIHRITRNDGDFVGAFRQNVIRVIGSYGREHQSDEYSDQIKAKAGRNGRADRRECESRRLHTGI